jgi:hypothetical protein
MSLRNLTKGLKGYILGKEAFGPGFDLYLSFINDAANKLPESHPIKLRLSDPMEK